MKYSQISWYKANMSMYPKFMMRIQHDLAIDKLFGFWVGTIL